MALLAATITAIKNLAHTIAPSSPKLAGEIATSIEAYTEALKKELVTDLQEDWGGSEVVTK